jgi:NADH-quinone oxidoreductase subunit L
VEANSAAILPFILALPLIGGVVNGLFGKRMSRQAVYAVANAAVVGAFFLSVLVFIRLAAATELDANAQFKIHLWDWIVVGDYKLELGLMADHLSTVMLLVITGIGSLIHLYSTSYMAEDPGYARYFAYLNLFIFSMLTLVLGSNLAVMFIGWEGVGACSYLLIGFWFTDMQKAEAGQKAFVVNRIGDMGFVIGLFLLLAFVGTVDYAELKTALSDGRALLDSPATITAICLLFFVGACGKSAQIPLYVWLPDAMAGPTPVSALIHAATMVTAGVYMIARLSFLFALSPAASTTIMMIGALTAFFAASIGLVQKDIKGVLAYSTVSQLGYMFIGVGAGAYAAGIFHLFTHAFFKACLFLGAGAVIHALHHEQNIFKMGGLKAKMPIVRWTFLIACVAIAGVPGSSGFFSKDAILAETLASQAKVEELANYYEGGFRRQAKIRLIVAAESQGKGASAISQEGIDKQAEELRTAFIADASSYQKWHYVAFVLGLLGAFMTAFYMFRLYLVTFHGEYRGDPDVLEHAHDADWPMATALGVLAFFAAVAGLLGLPYLHNKYNLLFHWLEPSLARGEHFVDIHMTLGMEIGLQALSAGVGLAGIGLAWAMYKNGPGDKAAQMKARFEFLHRALTNKYWIDELYHAAVVTPLRSVSQVLFALIDRAAIEFAMVRGPGYVLLGFGELARRVQTGEVQTYLVGVVLGLAGLAWYLV